MRNFFRTPVGKAINYLLCICFITVWILAIVLAAVMVEEEIYVRPQNEVIDEFIEEQSRYRAENAAWQLSAEGEISQKNTNFEYQVEESDGKIVYKTNGYNDTYDYLTYWCVKKSTNGDVIDLYEINNAKDATYTIMVKPKMDFPVEDSVAVYVKTVRLAYQLRYGVIAIGVAAFVLAVIVFVCLMSSMAHKPGTDDIQEGFLAKSPFDVELFGVICVVAIMAGICDEFSEPLQWVFALIMIFIILCMTVGLCMSIAVKVKNKRFIKGCLVIRIISAFFRFLGNVFGPIFRSMSLLWKAILLIAAISLAEFIAIAAWGWDTGDILFMWFIEKMILVPVCLWAVLEARKLQEAGEAIASGNLEYKTDTSKLHFDFKKHGENLNSISDGMTLALEDRVKSERMKTELITNVSHDIKTPLTSIINYATLLGEEDCGKEQVGEYSEVLVRQSTKLKRLLEDLVEASKAATGNLEVELMHCNPAIFVDQAGGEYEDKLKAARLTLVTKLPEEELSIMADGRRMWRIFDNLMNNICKYSMPDTRVYMNLEAKGEDVVISIKNTSREQLNISEEELMERFVRGDSSRNTEGNGLGLSIAKNLAELQGGELKIDIDGDLFKAMLIFKKA